ncbi:MAG: hypothetical protein M3Y13_04260 [Armatimonadota bacterium]|nr:hypothetical protein [Armatimonadota bacterium]
MTLSEEKLTENVRRTEGVLAQRYGGFLLFGLFQTEETAGKWDVVASAPWLTMGRPGIEQIVNGLRECLSAEDWLKTASIVPLNSDTAFVRTMTRLFRAEHEVEEAGPFVSEDLHILRAFIITASKRPAQAAERQAAA